MVDQNERVQELISLLLLEKHFEGGYFKFLSLSDSIYNTVKGDRRMMSSIYYLLEGRYVNPWHKHNSDEIWSYYEGSAANLFYIDNKERVVKSITLGKDLSNKQTFQHKIPPNTWMAAEALDTKGYTLFSCTCAPEFLFSEFSFATPEDLKDIDDERVLRFMRKVADI